MRTPSRSNTRAPHITRDPSLPSTEPGTDARRRRFLFALGAGSAGAVAIGAAAPAAVACGDPPPTDDAAAGYRETEHVRHYYRTAKI